MVWTIQSVEIENLYSYRGKQPTLEFDDSPDSTFLVCGENLGNTGTDSNGAGKSSLFDAISWVIFGKAPRSNSLADIITHGEDVGGGSVTLTNGSGRSIRITRYRGLDSDKRVKKLVLEEGSEDTFHDLSDRLDSQTQDKIYRLFGMDEKRAWEDYLSRVYFTSSTSKGFLSSSISPRDRQACLERFLNLGTLDTAAQLAKDKAKELSIAVMHSEADIEANERLFDPEAETKIEAGRKAAESKAVELQKILDALATGATWLDAELQKSRELKSAADLAAELLSQANQKAESIRSRYQKAVAAEGQSTELRDKWVKDQPELTRLEAQLDQLLQGRETVADKVTDAGRDIYSAQSALDRTTGEIARLEQLLDKQDQEILQPIRWQLESAKYQLANLQQCPKCGTELQVDDGTIELKNRDKLQNLVTELTDKFTKTQEERKGIRDSQVGQLRTGLTSLQQVLDSAKAKEQEALSTRNSLDQSIADVQSQLVPLRVTRSKVSMLPPSQLETIKAEGREHNTYLVEVRDKAATTADAYQKFMASRDLTKDIQTNKDQRLNLESQLLEHQLTLRQADSQLKSHRGIALLLQNLKTRLVETRKEFGVVDYWVKTFPVLKTQCLQVFIPSFEVSANRYLERFGVRERVSCELDGGFSLSVFDGTYWRDFDTFSAGERARVLVASGYALRDLSSAGTTALGFLFVDELLDTMDASGIDHFFELSRTTPGQKFVITQSKPEEVRTKADGLLLVTKAEDRSTVRMEKV